MSSRFYYLLTLLTCLFNLGVGEAEAHTPPVFKQDTGSNGLVSMETENYYSHIIPAGATNRWDKVTTTGQSGTGGMKANPNSGVNNDTGYTTKSARLDYKIDFVKTGTHYIWVRGIGATGSDDSLHAGLDGQALTTSDRITYFTTSWTWSKKTADGGAVAAINVATTGEHTLNLWMREDGMVIDKIVVTTSSSYTPSGTGPAESAYKIVAAPVLNTATAGDKQVTLSWAAATGATGYKIYYGTTPAVYGPPVSIGNTTTSAVTGLINGTMYYFAVKAYNGSVESAFSNEKSATPAAPVTEDPTLFIKNVDYNAAGQMTKVEYGNGDVTDYEYYDNNLRLRRIHTVDKNGADLQDLNYTYDSVGNILSITDYVNTADQTFEYDELNRLKQAVGQSYGTKTYVYDAIGNIVAKDGKTYFYGGTSGGPHAVTSLSDGTTFSYDANGNMATKVEGGVTTAYTYDAENRLTKVVKNGSTIGQYEYDGDGGRTTKTATVAGQTTTTQFVGSLFEISGARSTKFIFLGDQRIAAVTNSPAIGSTTLYYHADHLGGANVLSDATGFKKELIEYEPFGLESRHEKYGSSEEVAWYYFTGKKTDDESGLTYFGARYYDPSLGKFITPDTIVQNPSDPQTLNRYSYTSNNPINRIDPDGHSWWKKLFKKIGDFFDGAVRWLEKVTNSKWYVNVEVGQSHKFQDAQTLARGTAEAITQPWQIGVGVYRWAYESRFRILKNPSFGVFEESQVEDYDNVFVNGILNNVQQAFENAERANGYQYKSLKVAYNPTDGAFADVTEAFLQKLFFTSSVDRQLANAIAGRKGIVLSGHSQGAIIAANALVNLGLRGQRGVVTDANFQNTQITEQRARLSAAFAGVGQQHVTYGSRYFDPSNVGGPNLTDPLKFLSGIPGLYLPFGSAHHGIE